MCSSFKGRAKPLIILEKGRGREREGGRERGRKGRERRRKGEEMEGDKEDPCH